MKARAWFYAQGQRWAALNASSDFWLLAICAGMGTAGRCVPYFALDAFREGVRDARGLTTVNSVPIIGSTNNLENAK